MDDKSKLKPYNELRKLDISDYIETRKAKDENKKDIEVGYLPWAHCIDLLHQNGATNVYFEPVKSEDGTYLHKNATISNKDGKPGGCYFVEVKITIDDLIFNQSYPLMNGIYVVYDDTLNQLRVSTAHARAFVKGVAIRTGLGLELWMKNGDDTHVITDDDISIHNVLKVKERIGQKITAQMQKGMSLDDILSKLEINQKQLDKALLSADTLFELERRLDSK